MSSCRLVLPSVLAYPRATPGFNTQALANASHRFAFAFVAQDTATINALGFRLSAITGSAPTYQIEVQGLDSAGLPDGTGLPGSSATFNPTSLGWTAGSFNWISIPGVTLTRGTAYTIVIRHSSGTIDASNNATISFSPSSIGPESYGLPYPLADTGSGWSKNGTSDLIFGYRSSSVTYGFPMQSWVNGSLATNGHRAALKLTLDSGWGATCRVRGLMIHYVQLGAGGSSKLGIWNGAGSELAACAIDNDHTIGTARALRAFFDSAPVLNFGSTYYFGIERVSTGNITPRYLEVAQSRDLEAYPWSTNGILSTWDGSSWTDTDTQVPALSIIMEDWSSAPSSAGYFISA